LTRRHRDTGSYALANALGNMVKTLSEMQKKVEQQKAEQQKTAQQKAVRVKTN
jgi:hypothetical protein